MKFCRLYIIILSVFVIGCTENEFSETVKASLTPHYLNTSINALTFPCYKSENDSICIYSLRTSWKINNTAIWLKTSPSFGDEASDSTRLHISVDENLSGDTARANIMFLESSANDWQFSKAINVIQAHATPYINIAKDQITLPGRSELTKIFIQSNCSYKISSSSWLNVTLNDNELNIIAETIPDNLQAGRDGEIILVGSNISKKISVHQAPINISARTDTLKFENVAGSYTLSIESDLAWTASTKNSWISVTPETGESGISNICVSVSPNNSSEVRNGNVYLTIANKQIQIPVVQAGCYVKVDRSSIEIGSKPCTTELTISSNVTWNATDPSVNWLTLSSSQGQGESKIYLNTTDNATLNSRSCSITFYGNNSKSFFLDVTQSGRYLNVDKFSVSMFAQGGTETINVATDGKFSYNKSGDWFSAVMSNQVLTISIPSNTTKEWRSGYITIWLTDLVEGEKRITIPIEQAGHGISFDKKDYDKDDDWSQNDSSLPISIKIVNYKDDTDWSNNPEYRSNNFEITNYENDSDWSEGKQEGSSFTIHYYSNDEDWTSDGLNSGINRTTYNKDENWTE